MRVHGGDPGPLVEAVFRRIERERMADLPIHNPALQVAAVAFRSWEGQWLGVLVTPWSMALMLLPGHEATWVSIPENRRRPVRFPAGEFNFLGGSEADLGEYQTCPLFAAMGQFGDQAEAIATARAALDALLAEPGLAPAAAAAAKPATASASRRRFLTLGR